MLPGKVWRYSIQSSFCPRSNETCMLRHKPVVLNRLDRSCLQKHACCKERNLIVNRTTAMKPESRVIRNRASVYYIHGAPVGFPLNAFVFLCFRSYGRFKFDPAFPSSVTTHQPFNAILSLLTYYGSRCKLATKTLHFRRSCFAAQ